MKHPRFGDVRCVRSLRIIEKNEEIYEDYQYDTTNFNDTPRWYQEVYDEDQNQNWL